MMRLVRTGAAALCLAAATAACSGSGDTGSSGGWRVSGAHITTLGAAPVCRTPAPVLDTFSATPTPQPGCSPSPSAGRDDASASASPGASAAPANWKPVHVEQQYHGGSTSWHPIYTTYTAPPGTGIYQPMVHATNQPMPTPFMTPTPSPTPYSSAAPLRTEPLLTTPTAAAATP